MSWALAAAIFFILWWVTFFVVLPFSLRTQDDEDDVTLGTVRSAPRGAHVLRAMVRTTLVSLVLFGIWFAATAYFGVGIDDIPRIVPKFD